MKSLTLTGECLIDLHMHTFYSDGNWKPEELFQYLAEKKFALVSITDHDRIDRIEELHLLGQQLDVPVLAGVEITTEWRGRMGHMLAYHIDPQHPTLNALLQKTVSLQLENTRAVYQELRKQGYKFPRQAEVLADQGGDLVRPIDNARLLQTHGYAPSIQVGIEMMTRAGFRSIMADMGAAVDAVHQAGGVALIAHPGRREVGFTCYDTALLDEVAMEIPLDGIEVVHPTHSASQIAEYERYVARRGWLKSTGSDSHGPRHRYPIAHPAAFSRDLLLRCGIIMEVG